MLRSAPLARVSLLIGGVGVALSLWGWLLPAYSDPSAAARMLKSACDDGGNVVSGWHERMAAFRTSRYQLIDTGITLVSASATLLILGWALGVRQSRDVALALTPSRRWLFLVIGTLVIGLYFFGALSNAVLRYERQFYPWCADSIGIAFFNAIIGFEIVWSIFFIVGIFTVIWFGDLPAPLNAWNTDRPIFSWAISIGAGAIVLTLITLLMFFVATPGFGVVPAIIIAIYLAAAVRAALVKSRSKSLQ